MGFEFLGAIAFAVVTSVLLSAAPLILKKAGLFDLLGNSKWGTRFANFFGSQEPSKFAMNFCRVFFFLLIGFFVVSGITTDATQYELHKGAILQMETCNNSFIANQIGFGEWEIKCDALNRPSLNITTNVTFPKL